MPNSFDDVVPMDDEIETTTQVAKKLHVSPRTLEVWRAKRIGPPFLYVGKHVRYRRSDVRRWIADQARLNQSAVG